MSRDISRGITAQSIIESARMYRKSAGRKMTYIDYERYKQKLYLYGFYGYEPELAEALDI